jgi:hypothetical protein
MEEKEGRADELVDVDAEGDLSGGVETDRGTEELSRSRSSADESLVESLLPEVVRRRAAREVNVSLLERRKGGTGRTSCRASCATGVRESRNRGRGRA